MPELTQEQLRTLRLKVEAVVIELLDSGVQDPVEDIILDAVAIATQKWMMDNAR